MRTKINKKNKINTITLGCSKNLYDSEVLVRATEKLYIRIGDFKDVKITSADYFDLFNEIVT